VGQKTSECDRNIFQHNLTQTVQGSHYILVEKFKDVSRTFQDPEVAFSRTNSRRKFTAWTVLQWFNIYFCDYGTVL